MCFCVNIYEDMWAKEFLSALFREYWASKQMILSYVTYIIFPNKNILSLDICPFYL